MTRIFSVCKRVGSALLLCGLVGGLPVVLLSFGSPLPARWPSLGRIATDVRIGYVPSSLPGKFALAAGWVFWAFLTYEVIAETGSWIRLHTSRHSSALGPLQPVLSKLVAAIVLSAPLPGRGIAGASTPLVLSSTTLVERSPSSLESEPPPAPVSLVALPTYVVKPHDTLWGIAERYLGNPLRWSEIATLNEGRSEGPASFGNPHWIYPGWTLVLPADATGLATTDSDVVPPSGVPPSAPSERGVPSQPVSAAAVPNGVEGSPVQSATGGGPHTAGRRPEFRDAAGKGLVDRAGTHRQTTTQRSRSEAVPIGLGLLGAAVILLLDRLRRVQQRRRPRGVRIKLPAEDLADLEGVLRTGADTTLASDLEIGIRLFGLLVVDELLPLAAVRVAAVRCRADRLDFVLDGEVPASLPLPFVQIDGTTWALPRDWRSHQAEETLRRLTDLEPPFPALVTLGQDPSGELLVNLEALGSASVVGSDAAMVLQGMIVELCTAPWAENVDVVVVGHPNELRGLERARQVPSLAGAVAVARRRREEQDELLTEIGAEGTLEARLGQATECSDLLVVVGMAPVVSAEPDASVRLSELASDGNGGLAVLLGGDAPARWHIEAGGGSLVLHGPENAPTLPASDPDSEGAFVPQELPAGLLDGVDALIETATDATGTPLCEVTTLETRRDTAKRYGGHDSADSEAEEFEIEVRVLGPVEVAGVARPFTRAFAMELVVYLALHPDGATTDRWSEALWPGRLMAAPSLHSTASAARRSLGVSATGTDHLPRSHGRLALGPAVTTDWARLQRLAARDTPADRRAALRLIRGRPFEGLRGGGEWALLEGFVASIEAVVVDLSVRHAEWSLETGDPAGAEWTARQGLRVSAYDERLYRILLRAADAAGHPAGVEAAFEELVRLVADDIEPADSVHPETLALYRQLSRHPGARRGA
jgi:hypothetical protein